MIVVILIVQCRKIIKLSIMTIKIKIKNFTRQKQFSKIKRQCIQQNSDKALICLKTQIFLELISLSVEYFTIADFTRLSFYLVDKKPQVNQLKLTVLSTLVFKDNDTKKNEYKFEEFTANFSV